MTISKSICIDTTYGISARSMEVLYSIVTCHPETGKTEINAITVVLPQTAIHFCNFHVLRAWQQNLDSKVKSDVLYISEQLGKYKQKLKNGLKDILVESDEETFLEKIDYFTEHILSQDDFEFFYDEEVERIHVNNRRMRPVENKLSQHSYAASQIQEDILSTMIISPSGEIRNSMNDSDGE
ncbi:hypothetical protein PHYBLDRAFT_140245 [Phycomyces blakesleeanus NRRL 1555(-)]|uniref:MULE transposase domain-containing protein n=1 Tax=Phycomyces blakesleeanus (strain ATCC 8743b / DSM 1359 / FGSC 10004 / NBRC 33097 / NRRL 1555) TaxID=763407 RepID=A0A167QTA5_PHYB8|nr:hypothetical protein PHYBLDRAFT_140245 [Phycomyces blakesleeanus NRRL 1555(-)]OAD80241.1 hypothetical protein PHYBLDRAFT_140245 [Phycomyces blakesleeanus NRRL 1555(-)]|eukprot:XP_018298281.1 hypothetical protein PHYBLDRAFT_140245 [Phycomyces blakesleeanus NRRL 1555(-)]